MPNKMHRTYLADLKPIGRKKVIEEVTHLLRVLEIVITKSRATEICRSRHRLSDEITLRFHCTELPIHPGLQERYIKRLCL